MEKKQVSREDLNRAVAEFIDSIIQRAREIRDLDIEAIVDLVIKRTLEAFPPKQPSAYEDKPVVFWFDWIMGANRCARMSFDRTPRLAGQLIFDGHDRRQVAITQLLESG